MPSKAVKNRLSGVGPFGSSILLAHCVLSFSQNLINDFENQYFNDLNGYDCPLLIFAI